jgi:hypothetical protein
MPENEQQWIKIERWAEQQYGEDAPGKRTLCRWAEGGKLSPPAQKHGKAWYVRPGTQYGTPISSKASSLINRMRQVYGTPAP